MVQLGLLGLQVLPEGLLQCRTQQWNSSASTNTEGREEREGGRQEKEGKREGRKKKREKGVCGGGGDKEEEGRGEGMGGTNHVTSLLLTSPRAATKGGMPSYLLYRVGLPYFLSPRREKDGESNECGPFAAHPHTHTHTPAH